MNSIVAWHVFPCAPPRCNPVRPPAFIPFIPAVFIPHTTLSGGRRTSSQRPRSEAEGALIGTLQSAGDNDPQAEAARLTLWVGVDLVRHTLLNKRAAGLT